MCTHTWGYFVTLTWGFCYLFLGPLHCIVQSSPPSYTDPPTVKSEQSRDERGLERLLEIFFHSNNRRRGSKSSIKNQRHSHFYTQFFWGLEKWTSRRTFSQTDKVAGRGRRTGIELGRSKRLVWACSTVFGVFFLGMDLMRHSHTQKIFSFSPNWKRVIFFGYNVANLKLPIVLYGTTPCLSLLWKRRKLFFWHPPLEIRFSNWKVVVQRRRTVDNKKKTTTIKRGELLARTSLQKY